MEGRHREADEGPFAAAGVTGTGIRSVTNSSIDSITSSADDEPFLQKILNRSFQKDASNGARLVDLGKTSNKKGRSRTEGDSYVIDTNGQEVHGLPKESPLTGWNELSASMAA